MTALDEKQRVNEKPGLLRSIGKTLKKAVETCGRFGLRVGLATIAAGAGVLGIALIIGLCGATGVGLAIAQAGVFGGMMGGLATVVAGQTCSLIGLALWNDDFSGPKEGTAAKATSAAPSPSLLLSAPASWIGHGLAFNAAAKGKPAIDNEPASLILTPRRSLGLKF
jgi:hypothetical protein